MIMDKRIPKRRFNQLVKKLHEIANNHDVTLKIHTGKAASFYDVLNKHIQIGIGKGVCQGESYMLSMFFHELGHHVAYTNKKYIIYHEFAEDFVHEETVERMKIFVRTALKAERYVDKIGQELMKQYFPKGKYYAAHFDPEVVKFVRELYIGQVVEHLKSIDAY